jgi:HlyD family secretion protein
MTNPTASQAYTYPDNGLRPRVVLGLGIVTMLAAGIGGWAANAKLSGAVIAPGHVVVETNIKKVQHPTGGVVGEILVKSGDLVNAGDVVMRLDDTQTKANLGIILTQLTELNGRKARLAAERDNLDTIQFPDGYDALSDRPDPEALRVATGERRLFEVKRKLAEGRKGQLRSRIEQYRSEISGLGKQEHSKSKELRLVKEELDRLEALFAKKLVPQTRVLAMQRDEARIQGEHGALLSQVARAGGQINETELQILEIDENAITESQKEYREIEARVAELNERKIGAEDVMKRIDLRAPRSGIVHELAVHTVGGVIAPGDVVMGIVPKEDAKTVEVKLMPTDIDQVSVGQQAVLRFPAFNQRVTPEINGKISRLAADVSTDPQTGAEYYVARVSVTEDEFSKLGKVQLIPGMPVESYIQTGERTALSYITKPLQDNFARSFKEE